MEPVQEELIDDEASVRRAYEQWQDRARSDEEAQSEIEIGEIKVTVKTFLCCGIRYWMGWFPDGTICCTGLHSAPDCFHSTRDESILCAKLRVAVSGFQMVLSPQE